MHIIELIAMICVVSIIASVLTKWLSTRQSSQEDLVHIEKRLDNLEALQKRVEILEAIVTDKGYDLKQKIDSLR